MSFPFLFITGALISGIGISSVLNPGLKPLLLVTAFLLLLSWMSYFLKKTRIAFIFILITFAAAGASLFTSQNIRYDSNDLHTLPYGQYLDFYGKLSKSPSRGLENDILILKVERIGTEGRVKEVSGNLRISIPKTEGIQKIRDLLVGDELKVSARLSQMESFRNFKSPASQYYKIQNIHNKAYSKSPLLIEKTGSPEKAGFARFISKLRNRLQNKIEDLFSDENGEISEQGAVMEALLLGERKRIPGSLTQDLQSSGLYHLFAISGAHIAILSFLIFSFLKSVRIPERISYGILMIILVFYALLVEGRPSVIRATIMTLAYLTAKLIWSKADLLNTLSLSAFIILAVNPMQLFSLGFQLTFMATLSIILFFPKVMKFLPRLPLRLSEIFALSLTAYIGVMPFIALSFNRITFSSLVLNLAAIPLLGLIMAAGYLFIAVSFVVPFLANILADVLNLLIQGLIYLGRFTELVPFVSYRIPTPPIIVVLTYFVLLFALLIPLLFKRQKRILIIFFLASFAVLITYPFSSKTEDLTVTVMDVGQGESILVEFPGRKKMLVDGGGLYDNSYDIGEKVVSRFLWNKGIKRLDIMVLTHAHPDHLHGLNAVSKNFKINEFWEAFSPQNEPAYDELKRTLKEKSSLIRTFRGFKRTIAGVRIDVLHPRESDPTVVQVHNDQSIVLRLSYGNKAILLPGDIGEKAESEILEHTDELKSQVLKSPHHGSRSSSSLPFLESVSPEIIAISIGNRNFYGLPDPLILDRYHISGAKIFRTDFHGAIEIQTNGQEIRIRTSVSPVTD